MLPGPRCLLAVDMGPCIIPMVRERPIVALPNVVFLHFLGDASNPRRYLWFCMDRNTCRLLQWCPAACWWWWTESNRRLTKRCKFAFLWRCKQFTKRLTIQHRSITWWLVVGASQAFSWWERDSTGHFTKGCLAAHLWTCTHFMKRHLLPHGLSHTVVGGWYPAVLSWWERVSNSHLADRSACTSTEMHALHEDIYNAACTEHLVVGGRWLVHCDILIIGERPPW